MCQAGKFIFGDKNTEITIKIGNSEIMESGHEKLLGITLNKKLNFKKHIEDLCRMANQKSQALARLSNYVDSMKLEILINSCISSQFNYCPLVWMLNDRATNAKLNDTFQKVLWLVCKGSESELNKLKKNIFDHSSAQSTVANG